MSKFNINLSELSNDQLVNHYWYDIMERLPFVDPPTRRDNSFLIWKNSYGETSNVNFPAKIWLNNRYQEWYVNGVIHRIDGPALIDGPNHIRWVYKGRDVTGRQCTICLRLDCPTTKENFV